MDRQDNMDVPQAVRIAHTITDCWRKALAEGIDTTEHVQVLRMDLDTLKQALDVIAEWAPAS